MHTTARDSLRARGIRLRESVWKELEAAQIRRGDGSVQDTVREAVRFFLNVERSKRRAA